MSNVLNIAKSFSKQDEIQKKEDARQEEAQSFNLASNGGYLTFVKYALFSLLGLLNFRLFYSAIGGLWGIAVGVTAIMAEGFAIYCWNQQHKSAGKHRVALQFFSVAFTVVSLAHGAASLYELINARFDLGPSIQHYVFWYSHVVAFPLVFGLMILALFVLGFTHWQAKVAKAQAASAVEIAKDRADLLRRTSELKNETELAQAELAHYREKLAVDREFTALLKEVVEVENDKQATINSIPDSSVRDRIARMLGTSTPQPAVAQRRIGGFGDGAKLDTDLSPSSRAVIDRIRSKDDQGKS